MNLSQLILDSITRQSVLFCSLTLSDKWVLKLTWVVTQLNQLLWQKKLLPRVNLLKTVTKMVEDIFPENKQEFDNVCLACNNVAQRTDDISLVIKKQLGANFWTWKLTDNNNDQLHVMFKINLRYSQLPGFFSSVRFYLSYLFLSLLTYLMSIWPYVKNVWTPLVYRVIRWTTSQ